MVEMRQFETGATRNIDTDKLDYEGFLSPLVVEEYGNFMHRHRLQADGKLRESDNWQKGIPFAAYMKSMWRHFFNVWKYHRGYPIYNEKGESVSFNEEACALMFNIMGYLHEFLKQPTEQVKNSSKKPEFDATMTLEEEMRKFRREREK